MGYMHGGRRRGAALAVFAALFAGWTLPAAPRPVVAQPAQAAEPDLVRVRAELDELLRQVTAAVGAADQTGYLSHISKSDPCFTKEQENWAKDLERKPPEKFEVALSDADITIAPDGAAEGRLKWSWRVKDGRDRSLNFIGRFVRGETGWLYAGEKWNVLEGDHCKVSYANGLEETAKLVVEILPEVRAHIHEGFELTQDKALTERVQQVKLYASMRHLQHSIYLSYRDSLGGWNEPGEAVKIMGSERSSKGSLRTLLGHEYGHVATFQLGPKATDMPWWILEGVAELSAEAYSHDEQYVDRTVRRWASSDGLIDWEKLADFRGEATQHMMQVYTQGHHMLSYISERFGRSGRNKWLRAMAQGATLEDGTKAALGIGFAELDKAWRESLAKEPTAETPPDKPAKPDDKQP